jgi:hypothetical protein
VSVIECGHDFRIHDHLSINNQIRYERPNTRPLVFNREAVLLFDTVTTLTKLDDECILLKFFIQTRLQGI